MSLAHLIPSAYAFVITTLSISWPAHALENGVTRNPLLSFDAASAQQCYQSWDSFHNRKTTDPWDLCNPPKTLSSSDYVKYVATSIFKSIQAARESGSFSVKDGITRFQPAPSASFTETQISMTFHGWKLGPWTTDCEDEREDMTKGNYGEPSCTVPKQFCDDRWESYIQRVRTFSETEPFQTVPGKPISPCDTPVDCAINFQYEVVLLYWPSGSSTDRITANDTGRRNNSAPVVQTITEIPFKGKDRYQLFWVTNGDSQSIVDPMIEPSTITISSKLTSPTIYLAHRAITSSRYIRDQTDAKGSVYPYFSRSMSVIKSAGIIPLNPEDVFSKRPKLFRSGDPEQARQVASGIWRPEPGQLLRNKLEYETKLFDFQNLYDPVPFSIWLDARDDCWGEQTHCATITDGTYRPQILLANHVWRSLLGDNYVCELPTIVDPPITLTADDGGDILPAMLAKVTPLTTTAVNDGFQGIDSWKNLFDLPSVTAVPGHRPAQGHLPRQTIISPPIPEQQAIDNSNGARLWGSSLGYVNLGSEKSIARDGSGLESPTSSGIDSRQSTVFRNSQPRNKRTISTFLPLFLLLLILTSI
jgi:hypothetical protein